MRMNRKLAPQTAARVNRRARAMGLTGGLRRWGRGASVRQWASGILVLSCCVSLIAGQARSHVWNTGGVGAGLHRDKVHTACEPLTDD
ncbi:hypothetical protein PRtIB026_A44640 [Pseudomonas sp. RtIB026]|nr:hypothetical protein PRtIB026_A44640 [Pseudomonas sp. RtIB026]